MRVEAIDRIPEGLAEAGTIAGDASVSLAIRNFVAAIENDDSLLRLVQPLLGPSMEVAEGGGFYIGEMLLEFREAEHTRKRTLHFQLVEKLIELLKAAGSNETLAATICLTTKAEDKTQQKELALWLRLSAKGESPEQAALRWGLGLTHIQQALLFTSRHLRMQLTQAR